MNKVFKTKMKSNSLSVNVIFLQYFQVGIEFNMAQLGDMPVHKRNTESFYQE